MTNNIIEINSNHIKSLIYLIRGKQVMLDSDLAKLYQVETKQLTRQVRRNISRFPEKFMFQLTKEELANLRCQIGTSSLKNEHGGRRYSPYVFTEQGIAMLSAILRSDIAIQVSIRIMDAFVEMRRFLVNNEELFSRIAKMELKQLETDEKLEQVFNYIATSKEVTQKIFFEGQIYDAFTLFIEIIQKADKNIILIDNYISVDTLNILAKRKNAVKIDIYTSKKTKISDSDTEKFNSQYKNLKLKFTDKFHDRFLILDKTICYHIGASLKDAGKKSFAITKFEDKKIAKEILAKIN